jgi:hypothetical protein
MRELALTEISAFVAKRFGTYEVEIAEILPALRQFWLESEI